MKDESSTNYLMEPANSDGVFRDAASEQKRRSETLPDGKKIYRARDMSDECEYRYPSRLISSENSVLHRRWLRLIDN